jgi:hypothetical protein
MPIWINQKQELQNLFYEINFDKKSNSFKKIFLFEKKLQEFNFTIKFSTVSLIYFNDMDRPYQDSSGIEYILKIENRHFKEYFFNVQHFNWSSLKDARRIYCEKPKEFEDYSEWIETYDLSFLEFLEENENCK